MKKKKCILFQPNNKPEIKPEARSNVSEASKEEAEYHKNCGNDFMKIQNNEKAIEAYTKYVK